MKILHVGKYYPPEANGGIESVTRDLVEGTRAVGIKTDVLCFGKSEKNSLEGIYRERENIFIFSTPISFAYVRQLRRIIKNYNVVHVHLPNPLPTFVLALIPLTKVKLVVHWHSDIVKQKTLLHLLSPFVNRVLRKSDAIVVTSEKYLDGSLQLKGVRDKVTIIPIGTDVRYRADEKFEVLQSRYAGKIVVLSVGRLTYYKGFEYLIKAARYLPDNFVVCIIGKGPDYDALSKLIKEEDVAHKVELIGYVPDECIGNWYELSTMFCLPSVERSEAFGVVLLEAFYFGKPVVSCDIPHSGVSSVNLHDITGLIVAPKSPKAIAEACVSLATPSMCARMSAAARDRYLKEYTRGTMVKKFNELYEKLLRS